MHGVSAAVMVAMLLVVLPPWLTVPARVGFAAATGWCLLQVVRRVDPASYLRLGICCLAMVVMLAGAHPHGGAAMRAAMGPAEAMTDAGPGSSWPAVLVALALAPVVLGGLGRLGAGLRRPSGREPGASRGSGAAVLGLAETLLAAAMAAMLVGVL